MIACERDCGDARLYRHGQGSRWGASASHVHGEGADFLFMPISFLELAL
jgi:hypothetical protein